MSAGSDNRGVVVTNILLILVLGAIVFLCIAQREIAKEAREGEERLYGLMRSHAGHVWTEDLKKEGRRLAFAEHFAAQVLKGTDRDRDNFKKLLEHGAEGIESYLSLKGGREVVFATRAHILTDISAVWQESMSRHFPIMKDIINNDEVSAELINSTTKGEKK